jgi:hypothetical protein
MIMATIAQAPARIRADRLFYTSMGFAIAATTFWGFAASFYLSAWLVAPPTAPDWTSLLYVHGGVFSVWMVLMVVQPMLIASRNVALHRRLGYFGVAVAVAMVLVGNASAVAAMHGGFKGLGDPLVFYAVPFFAINSFAVAVFLAFRWRNRAETHKRLILLANVGILGAAIARIPVEAIAAGAPFSFMFLPNLITVSGMVFDWRTRGRVHPVWIWGGLAMLASQIAVFAVMGTGWWRAFAQAMAGLY